MSADNNNLTATYPTIHAAALKLKAATALVDGEIVPLDANGKPSFQALQHRSAHRNCAVVFYAFDLLHLDGVDLTKIPLEERRKRLPTVVKGSGVLLSEPLPGNAQQVIEAVSQIGFEGNHQLERTYNIERARALDRGHETKVEIHQRLAEKFLNTPEMRALRHPKPTPRQCYLNLNGRPMLFDAKQHRDLARQVPPEAYRRFTADEDARTERGMDKYTRQAALHRERLRFIAEWVATRGTTDQQERHAANMLPLKEVLEGLADEAFAVVDRPHYTYDGVERLQQHLRRFQKYSRIVLARANVSVTTMRAETATDPHWALKRELEDAIPGAKTTMRIHWLRLKNDPAAPKLTQFGVLVFKEVGPFTVKREWLVTEPARDRVSNSNDITNAVALQENLIEEEDLS